MSCRINTTIQSPCILQFNESLTIDKNIYFFGENVHFCDEERRQNLFLGGAHDCSAVIVDSGVNPLPIVSHISEDGVRSLTSQPVAHVSDEDMLAIDNSCERTTTVSLQNKSRGFWEDFHKGKYLEC